jgi:hypothetical protein
MTVQRQQSKSMSSETESTTCERRPVRSSRWAPWWLYVLVIAPANIGKEQLLPDDTAWWLRAMVTAALVAAGVALLTAMWRVHRGRSAQC